MLTKEQIFGAFAHNVACADGNLDSSEIKRIISVASANELDVDAVVEACKKECENRSDLTEVVKQMTEDEKELILFAAIRIAVADGKIAIKEIRRVHSFGELFGWGPQYTTIEFVKQLKKDPSLLVEGVDF